MREATIRDVAARAGVSVATVSRVLAGGGPVAPATRDRVHVAARALRYAPHAAARSLSLRRAGALGAILPDLHGEFFSEFLRGLDGAAQRRGHHLLVSSSHHGRDGFAAALQAMRGRVDGLVVMGPDLERGVLAEALPAGLPAVLVNSEAFGAGAHELRVDNFGGARTATAHLLALGHRRVAHARGAARNFDARERLLGYRAALAAAGVAARADYEVGAEFSEAGGYGAARALMALPEPPTALFCANDAAAIGALSALRELGVAVPGRVAVVGFDDVPMARYACPPLTSVRAHVEALGARAAAVLLDVLAAPPGASPAPVRELLPAALVVRASCGGGPATGPPSGAPLA